MEEIKLEAIRCPNCNRAVGLMSKDTKGIQKYICRSSRCRYEFFVVDGSIDENFARTSHHLIA